MAKKARKPTRHQLVQRRKAAKLLSEWRNSPAGRLEADGATKCEQMNRRALWIAKEWTLPRCPKIGRVMTQELADYCQTHNVSMDWLLCGDLKVLRRMMQAHCARQTEASPANLIDRFMEDRP